MDDAADTTDKCAICMERVEGRLTLPCQHSFCRECITLAYQSRRRACPLCRRRVTRRDLGGGEK